ncbi:MAG: transcriptional regulator [Gammaproteobacteria bacterium CG11_big_fil_rev_8_21_14_0_20_46_22]|nr:MAG: transcriptional regulator [Gammaproteobacteria bacterium CG12_big_fil_rev_8_21_14_0_65_46_12]PIR11385.1 MAG: transcriptional regulator [Gammaproteobacteria bacterium CG11_big_fil_rev_8_21_14_0_20_46_22]
MRKIDSKKVTQITGDYNDWLQNHLQDREAACAHLQAALDAYQDDQDKTALLLAIKDVAEAQGGIGWLSKETHLNREHLYYLLSGKGNPRLDTLSSIFKALGLHLNIAVAC